MARREGSRRRAGGNSFLPAESIGAVSSWDDLVKHQEAIQERVRFLRLKKLASYYDSAAIRRAVKRNRDKYGERYAGAEGFLARLDEWEKELGPLDRWVEQAGPGQAALLREMVDLRRKALIDALPEQNGLKAWVSVRRFNPSGKSLHFPQISQKFFASFPVTEQ